MKRLPVIVIGAGGHAKVLVDTLQRNSVEMIGVVDKNIPSHSQTVLGVPVIGDDETVLRYTPQEISLINGLGSVSSTQYRQQIFNKFKQNGYFFSNVVHDTAIVGQDVDFGEGIQVMAGAVIQPGCKLGNNIIINTRVSMDHDCIIHDHVHIAPGVTISGSVEIGEGTHIGTGAVIIQDIQIGKNSVIGAGAVVINDVLDNQLVVGVPAKSVNKA